MEWIYYLFLRAAVLFFFVTLRFVDFRVVFLTVFFFFFIDHHLPSEKILLISL